LQRAMYCLDLARRTPTAFNTQPYKVVLVYTPEQKLELSRYCLDVNGARVRDADCTAIFLADKQVIRTFPQFRQFLQSVIQKSSRRPLTRNALLKMQFYISLFSSGYPLPRFLAAPISFLVRTGVALVNLFTKWFYPMPTLSNAETWSSKQAMMVAMTYMLACTSRGLATTPMEGTNRRHSITVLQNFSFNEFIQLIRIFLCPTLLPKGINASGIRKVIQAPSRYAIPIIVCTGLPYTDKNKQIPSLDQDGRNIMDDRYGMEEVMFGDSFGTPLPKFPPPIST
jgi:nitroreductase